jgi:hypothetical protein
MFITFPALYGIDYSIKGNPVRQIAVDKSQRDGVLAPFTRGRLGGFVFQPGLVDEEVLIVPPEAKGYQMAISASCVRLSIPMPRPLISQTEHG